MKVFSISTNVKWRKLISYNFATFSIHTLHADSQRSCPITMEISLFLSPENRINLFHFKHGWKELTKAGRCSRRQLPAGMVQMKIPIAETFPSVSCTLFRRIKLSHCTQRCFMGLIWTTRGDTCTGLEKSPRPRFYMWSPWGQRLLQGVKFQTP